MPALPVWKSPLATDAKSRNGDYAIASQDDEKLNESPEFRHFEETSNLQLFFDLFFVANLTSFTNSHEINSRHKLASYIGFFCILWFTWAQVTLYDVRFATDSFFERLAHACHFGVMVGFAIVGPNFLLEHDGWGPLQQLSLMLCADRVVLLCEYASTLFFTWNHRSMRMPLIIVITSLGAAAAIYLGVSFAYYNQTHYDAYIAWYVVAVVEVGINLAVASYWDAMSFNRTQIVERMSCLTLIILGEGIIGLTRTIVKIETYDFHFTSTDIGAIISAVMLIYLIYQLYFDNLRREYFGPVRQQVWSMLHFPFHVALALTMEGFNQILLSAHIVRDLQKMLDRFPGVTGEDRFGAPDVAEKLNSTAQLVFSRFNVDVTTYNEIAEGLHEVEHPAADATAGETIKQVVTVFFQLMKVCAEAFGYEPGEEVEITNWNGLLEWSESTNSLGDLTFGYLCICTGLVCMQIGILTLLSQKYGVGQSVLRYVPIGANMLIGLGIILLSLMTLTDAANTMIEASWTLPGIMFVFFVLIWIQHLFQHMASSRSPTEESTVESTRESTEDSKE